MKNPYFVRTKIFATHIRYASPWIGRLFDSNIASSSINPRRPGMKSIFFASHIIPCYDESDIYFFEGIARIRNRDSSKTIAIDS